MTKRSENKLIEAFTADHICKITGLSQRQLSAWDKRGFFSPNYAFDDRTKAYSRIYSYKDAVGLRTIAVLRLKHKISLARLENVAKELARRGFDHWADTKLYVIKKEVNFQHKDTEKVEGLETGQYSMLPVIDVIKDVDKKILELKTRSKDLQGTVEKNKHVARNSSVIGGTRIPTATVMRYAEAGYSIQQILEEYPSLTKSDIESAIKFEKGLAKAV